MKLTDEQKAEKAARNMEICARYKALREAQPLATANKILTLISKDYGLTPQALGVIVRANGLATTNTGDYESN